MKDFFSNLSSIYWWISVVLVGIAINLVSAYLKNRLDTFLSGTSSWWKQRSEKQKEEKQRILNTLKANFEEQVFMSFRAMRDRVRSIFFLLFSVTFAQLSFLIPKPSSEVSSLGVNISKVTVSVISIVVLFIAMRYFMAAINKENLLWEARYNNEDKSGE